MTPPPQTWLAKRERRDGYIQERFQPGEGAAQLATFVLRATPVIERYYRLSAQSGIGSTFRDGNASGHWLLHSATRGRVCIAALSRLRPTETCREQWPREQRPREQTDVGCLNSGSSTWTITATHRASQRGTPSTNDSAHIVFYDTRRLLASLSAPTYVPRHQAPNKQSLITRATGSHKDGQPRSCHP